MYLTVIKPTAEITSLDLDHLQVWQLRLEAAPIPGSDRVALSMGVRYIAPGTATGTAFVQIVALTCKCSLNDLAPVLQIGFPSEREAAKDRLRESMKVLYNSATSAREVDEILPKTGVLVDTYFNIRDALFGKAPAMGVVGPVASGMFDGYRWAITRDRFESWCVPKDDDAPPAPGKEPEEVKLAEGSDAKGPPPGSINKGGRKARGTTPVE